MYLPAGLQVVGGNRMNRFTEFRKLVKYGALRHLPGERGYRYQRKYWRLVAPREFEKAITRCNGLTNVDLGANIGVYTKIFAARAKRVIAFEPDPWAMRRNFDPICPIWTMSGLKMRQSGTSNGKVLLHRRARFAETPPL